MVAQPVAQEVEPSTASAIATRRAWNGLQRVSEPHVLRLAQRGARLGVVGAGAQAR